MHICVHDLICVVLGFNKTHVHDSLSLILPYGKSIAASKSEFSRQGYPVFPLSSSSIFFFPKIIQQLLTSSTSSTRPFYLSFVKVFQKAVPTQLVTNSFSLPSLCCMQFIFPPLALRNSLFLHDHCKYLLHHTPAPRFKPSELFVIYFPESPSFINHKKLCSKCSIPLVSSLNLTHCGPVTQICVFTLQLCNTDDANLRF